MHWTAGFRHVSISGIGGPPPVMCIVSMRIVLPLFLVFWAVGCRTPLPLQVAWAGFGADHTATAEDIARAEQRINSLKPDMTDEQVFAALGLTHCYAYATGQGPASRFLVSYDLLNGHGLDIVHDCTVPPSARVASVSLGDAIWKRDETRSR
jgi:hypothetical protein